MLKGIKTYDMRGRVWWTDDFEATVLKWGTFAAGAGGSQGLSTAQARNRNQSVLLRTNIGMPGRSEIHRHIDRPRKRVIGIEYHLAMAANFGYIEAGCSIFDGTNVSYMGLSIEEAANRIRYRSNPVLATDTGFIPCFTGYEDHFHSMKIVCDFGTDEWIRVMWDHQELALNRIPMTPQINASACHLMLSIDAIGDGFNNANVHVDDVIVTIMEPE